MKSGFPPRRLNFFRLSLSALRAHILHGWDSAFPSTAQKLSCICVTSSLLAASRLPGIGNGLPSASAARRWAISTQSGVAARSESHQKSCIASISACTLGSGAGTVLSPSFGGAGRRHGRFLRAARWWHGRLLRGPGRRPRRRRFLSWDRRHGRLLWGRRRPWLFGVAFARRRRRPRRSLFGSVAGSRRRLRLFLGSSGVLLLAGPPARPGARCVGAQQCH